MFNTGWGCLKLSASNASCWMHNLSQSECTNCYPSCTYARLVSSHTLNLLTVQLFHLYYMCLYILLVGLTNGIDLSNNAVLKYTDQDLTADNIFENGFHVEGNITTTGLIDKANLPLLSKTVVLIDTYQVIEGTWKFKSNVTVYGEKVCHLVFTAG